jgi:hypothetical protein
VARRLGNKEGKEHKNQGKQNVEATPLLRLRLLDIGHDTAVTTSGLLTLWRPDGQLSGLLEDGRVLGLTNCLVGHQAGGGSATINLTVSRATQYLDIGRPAADALPPEACRRLTIAGGVGGADFRPPFNEVDLVVMVLGVGEPKSADFQHVFVCDRGGVFFSFDSHEKTVFGIRIH